MLSTLFIVVLVSVVIAAVHGLKGGLPYVVVWKKRRLELPFDAGIFVLFAPIAFALSKLSKLNVDALYAAAFAGLVYYLTSKVATATNAFRQGYVFGKTQPNRYNGTGPKPVPHAKYNNPVEIHFMCPFCDSVILGGECRCDERGEERAVDREKSMQDLSWEKLMKCDVPPHGWECTRERGHEGPCAAVVNPPEAS